ncbi:sulfatase-like hydrolase/transferase [Flavivirga amylovorans]|uniref:Sulfatase-like hydrolase/transferase n=1 Tax=Flavivirga amylovorans TaxID=870486 RepID=A0ABT8X6J1_9FLAO|nr:sulfatase-like hydrolase/transferase [Flavivirga amylovorans]MDO5989623.1 sulfatase-like hydrolase/transferase [Flavivirga amylovorans]
MKLQDGKNIIPYLFFITLTLFNSCTKSEEKKPNILFIMMDDLGYGQFGIYNDTITTADFDSYFVKLVDSLQGYSLDKSLEFSKTAIPTLTNLAKEGLVFTNAYTTSSICAPSRLGIATGTSQNRFGVYTNADCDNSGLIPGTHLAEQLKKRNYNTAHIGKWHIGKKDKQLLENIKPDLSKQKRNKRDTNKIKKSGYNGSVTKEQHPLNNGFDYYYGYNHWSSDFYNATNVWENFKHAGKQENYNTDTFTDKAIEFIDNQVKSDNPFYVQLHYHAVHDSLEPVAPKKYYSKFNSDSHVLNNFYAHVYGVDANVKRIIKYLKSKEEYKNTLIVFTSDNGAMSAGVYNNHKTGSPLPANTPFPGHKGTYFQGGIRVPMFVHWPKGLKTHGISNQLVSTMDILPTAIAISGGKVPDKIDGKSMLPLINKNTNIPIHDHLTWSGIHSYKWGYLITKSTKNVREEPYFAPPAWVVIKGDYLLRFTGILEKGVYLESMAGRDPVLELFNIKNDPAESHDLADKMPDLVKELSALYYEDSKDYAPPSNWKKSKWKELRKT